jgi:hypothetical protein
MIAYPGDIEVYQRIVNHIDRIRDVTKELACLIFESIVNFAACAHIYDGGK